MKLTILLIVIFTLQVSANVRSQDVKLNLNLQNGRIQDVFDQIEKQSDFNIFYKTDEIDVNKPITITAKDITLSELLNLIGKETDINYRVVDKIIVITPKGSNLLSQQMKITGVITDASTGEPLPGVNIIVEGTAVGVTSNLDGKYSIEITSTNAILVYSYIGYISARMTAAGQSTIDLKLTPDIKKLDEVVVVGYGTMKKKDLTGSVATVDAGQLKKYASNDISQMLQGRSSGISVTSDGEAGATPSVRIRGFSTFGNAEPLYVIDGVPISSPRDFNPNDIESVSILKDASAGAIYGSVAANGVVLITTKHGKKDTPLRIDYSAYYGTDKVWQKMPVTNRADFQMLQNEMLINGGKPIYPGNDPTSPFYNDTTDTDWQREALKTGTRQNHNLNFSGGSKNTTYNMSLDYYHSDGTLVGNGPLYDRYSVRINSETEKGIVKVGEAMYYTHSHQDGLTASSDYLSGGRPPMIGDIVIAQPTISVYDPSRLGGFGGTPIDGSQGVSLNVVGLNSLIKNLTDVDRTLANVWGEAKIFEGLKYRINLSYDRTNVRDQRFEPMFDLGYFFRNLSTSRLDDNSRIYTTGLVENTLTFEKAFGQHKLNVLVGQMYQKGSTVTQGGHSENLTYPYYPVLDNGSNKSSVGNETYNALFSYLGRINYEYGDRYLITATARRDGSSRFAPVNRYGVFPSIAAAWKLQNEQFFKLPTFISELKLRGSYGQLGNQNIADYLYVDRINQNLPYNFNGVKVMGSSQTQILSPTIRWETTTSGNVGFDAGFLENAIEWSVEYYSKKTTDILVGVPIPLTTGAVNTQTQNAGSLKNSGYESNLTYHKRKGKFVFDVSANITTLKNEVLSLGTSVPVNGTFSRTEVGRSIGEFYGYATEGIFQTQAEVDNHAFQAKSDNKPSSMNSTSPGDLKFKDLNGDNIINDQDRAYLGRAIPNLYYGLNLDARFMNFDFTFNVSGSSGNKIMSRQYTELMHTTNYMNYSTDMLKRWTPNNPNNDYPRLIQGDPNENSRMSDRKGWLQNGTYLRINTLSLGYTLSKNLIKYVSSVRIYGTCQNLYTFQYYKGFNPDFTSGVWNPGWDNGSFPKPRTIMFGIQASF